ncbi:MAG TPA: PRC-barrel domain-containing protein [Nocardioidaceae bacterium]|nr:PRC-barrel domain-containing protein [Nocardioidaceae bacterium]
MNDLDVGLRFLDHQIVGDKDELFGNVDNGVLEDVDGRLTLTGIVTGVPGLAPRIGGRVGGWMYAIWSRLRPETNPQAVVVPMTRIQRIDSAVTIDETAQEQVAGAFQLERWLRHYVVARIPGATGGPDRLAGEPLATGTTIHPATVLPDTGHLCSDLIGARVIDVGGQEIGRVYDLTVEPPAEGRTRVGSLAVTTLRCGRRRLGAEMGYRTDPAQGPWIIAAPLRAYHREDRVVPIDRVERIDWPARTVHVRGTETLRHPHDLT